jgi:hypothetical protein
MKMKDHLMASGHQLLQMRMKPPLHSVWAVELVQDTQCANLHHSHASAFEKMERILKELQKLA